MHIDSTPVSCGVDFIYSFYDSPEDEFAKFVRKYTELQYDVRGKPNGRPTCTFVFSGQACKQPEDTAVEFGQWLKTQDLGDVVEQRGRNPNSGNYICTFMWTPPLDKLKAHPLWEANRKQAISDRRGQRAEWSNNW